MSKNVSICDVCKKIYPSVQLRAKVKFRQYIPKMMSPYTAKYDLCERCWYTIEKACQDKADEVAS